MSSPVRIAGNEGDAPSQRQSKFYQLIMTPVIFVSFLFSLALVELRYTLLRTHLHSESPRHKSRLPAWLHRIVYREQPYRYVRVTKDGGGGGRPARALRDGEENGGGRWYYHSKQKKLLRMEVSDAFEIRNTVLVALGLLGAGAAWCGWRIGVWAYAALLRVVT